MVSFGRRCLVGTLGDSEEVAGFFAEVALVKSGVECISYLLSCFKNELLFSSVSQRVLPSQLLEATGDIFSI